MTLSTTNLWIEVIPVAQQLEITHVLDPTYLREIFRGGMRSGRMDSVLFQFMHMVGPSQAPWGIIAWDNGNPAALKHWVTTHAPPSALGFALAQDIYFLVFPLLTLWSLCLMAFRLIHPRPSWSAVFRQPGWWACVGAILGAALGMALETLSGHFVPSVIVPATVVVVWLALALSMKWKSESSWIDSSGRLIGMLWAGTIPFYLAGFVWIS